MSRCRSRGTLIAAAVALGSLQATATAQPASIRAAESTGEAATDRNPWEHADGPAKGDAEAIGGYSKGCLRGGVALPSHGPGFERMRPRRHRYFGHPELVEYVTELGAAIANGGHGLLLVGDLAHARGGPSTTGHSSHQSGLDVDLWFWSPDTDRLRPRQRHRLRPRSVVDFAKKKLGKLWKPSMAAMLRLAAEDERVTRIFVNPVIKRALCARTSKRKKDRSWLRKIRPWYGHADHFHVRLRCPPGSAGCTNQREVPAGDGCDELDWWFDEEAQAARKAGQKSYQKNVGARPELPDGCAAVLAAP